MGTRICIINQGCLVQVGHPMDVYRFPANTFVAGFLGSPPMNLLPADLGPTDIRLGNQIIPFPAVWAPHLENRPGAAVIFGIRPEDLFPADRNAPSRACARLEATVEAVEALGAETVFIFKLNGLDKPVYMKADRFAAARRGDRITVVADLSAARLFDPETTRVIPLDIETH